MASLPALYFGLKERRKSQQNQSVPRSRRDAGIGNVLGGMQEKESHPFRRKNYSLLFRSKGIQLSLCDAHLSASTVPLCTMRVSCSTSVILDVTLTGAARSCTHFVRLDGAEVLRVAFPVARRRRRPRLHSQIATAVSQTSPDLKERRKGKKRWERVR